MGSTERRMNEISKIQCILGSVDEISAGWVEFVRISLIFKLKDDVSDFFSHR